VPTRKQDKWENLANNELAGDFSPQNILKTPRECVIKYKKYIILQQTVLPYSTTILIDFVYLHAGYFEWGAKLGNEINESRRI
jgi:hypothetical protein